MHIERLCGIGLVMTLKPLSSTVLLYIIVIVNSTSPPLPCQRSFLSLPDGSGQVDMTFTFLHQQKWAPNLKRLNPPGTKMGMELLPMGESKELGLSLLT